MLPRAISEMIGRHTYFSGAGTRDDDRIPRSHRVWGVRLHPDDSVTFMVPPYGTEDLEACAVSDRHVALTIGELPSHETYQLKGRAVRVAPPSADDLSYFRAYRERMCAHIVTLGFPEPLARAWLLDPMLTVTMRTEEAFVQTPGPGAGRRLWPEEEHR
jgi:hypothetical protein